MARRTSSVMTPEEADDFVSEHGTGAWDRLPPEDSLFDDPEDERDHTGEDG
ncbi:hypothetical protein [Brevundimonas sp.]|uniref:hypothetical protein n=1 Tax=Brevundimonas sp. TaxID=1871086 RepID=UPI0025BAF5F2|nr:hypothetical protein [Brevundimonas sp.]